MSQKARLKKKRETAKGIAVKKNNNPDVVREVTKTYGNVKVTTYKKNRRNPNDKTD